MRAIAIVRSICLTVSVVALLSACASSNGSSPAVSASTSAQSQTKWVTAWGHAMANAVVSATDPAGAEQTYRTIVKPTVGSRGTARIHLSNLAGAQAVTIGALHVGVVSSGAAIASGTDVAVTFAGRGSTTIAAGQSAYSDPLPVRFTYGALLAVTTYVSGSFSSLPQHDDSLVTNYATPSGAGNATADLAGTTFTVQTPETFLVDRVDLQGDYLGTVAFAGSSTTQGNGSDPNAYDDIVDDVASDLHAAGRDDIALANMSLAPDPLLPKNDVSGNLSILERLPYDFFSLPNLRTIVQNTGDVDLKGATCSPATDIIAGDRIAIAQTHAAGARIVLAVVAPSTYCDGQNPSGYGSRFPAGSGQDGQRDLLNTWIVSVAPSVVSGIGERPPGADATVDLSTPITDPSDTGYMLPQYDSGDDSHPNAAGQALQAAAIPASVL